MSQPHLKVRMKSWERVLKTKSGSGFIVFYQGPKPKRQSLSFKVGQDCRKKKSFLYEIHPFYTMYLYNQKKKEMLEKFIRNIRLISTMHAFRTYFTKLLSNIYVLHKLIGILIRIRIFHDQVHSAESSDNNQMRLIFTIVT